MDAQQKKRKQQGGSRADLDVSSRVGQSIAPPEFGLTANPVQMQAGPARPDRSERERPERERPESEASGDFGVPYSSWAEAMAAETYLKTVLLPASAGMFGAEVMALWFAFLNREPGDDMTPRIYSEGGSSIAYAFKQCPEIAGEQNRLLDIVERNLSNAGTLPANEWATVPLSTFVGTTPLNIDHLEFQNPYNTPGHIAGGTGGWDTGQDARWVEGNVRLFRMTDENGATTNVLIEPDFQFRVVDAIDFIPGQPGTGLEQVLTIPLSRLEASGWAHDVPFEVHFTGPVQRRTVSGTALGPGTPNPDDAQREERQREPRGPREREESRSRLGEREDSRRRDF